MKHKANIARYLELGGNPKEAKRLKHPTLKNRARVTYLLSTMETAAQKKPALPIEPPAPKEKSEKPSKPKFLGMIAQYPIELHDTYNRAFSTWIAVCGLKLKLNLLPDEERRKAFEIQLEMVRKMEIFDRCKKALDHYMKHKRVLPTESTEDYSKLKDMELIKMRNNLRGLISRRKKTIRKMKKNLPDSDDEKYFKRLDMLNRKREQLQEKKLDLDKVQKLIKERM